MTNVVVCYTSESDCLHIIILLLADTHKSQVHILWCMSTHNAFHLLLAFQFRKRELVPQMVENNDLDGILNFSDVSAHRTNSASHGKS